ncbi:MAG: hypothetical protein HKN15_00015 [Xanthomonadales bacterium]|nr:hypothetical protein [Xanthomonadales bacterium]
MSTKNARLTYRLLLPFLMIFSLSCWIIFSAESSKEMEMEDLPEEDLPNFDFTGSREYFDPDSGDLLIAIRLDLQMPNDEDLRVGTMLTGCLAAREKQNRDRYEYVAVSGAISSLDPPEAQLNAPDAEGSAQEVTIIASVFGTAGDANPEIQFTSAHDPYNIPEPLRRSSPQRTCDAYSALFEGASNITMNPNNGLLRVPNLDFGNWVHANALSISTAPPAVTRDERFEGTYCQVGKIRPCRRVPIKVLGKTIRHKTVCTDLTNARLALEHFDGRSRGQLYGIGSFEARDSRFKLTTSGQVSHYGNADMSFQMPGEENRSSGTNNMHLGTSLQPGMGVDHRLTVNAFDETLLLSKQACGNINPRVSLTSLGGDQLVWGHNHCFRGVITQDEDSVIPAAQMRMSSSLDGLFEAPDSSIDSSGPLEITRCTTGLSPGLHTIDFIARDSGGLSSKASVDVEVTNRPPQIPVLVQPRTDDTVIAGGIVIFEGKVYDRDEGMLSGSQLNWWIQPENGSFSWIGSGRQAFGNFPQPGSWVMKLTATDGAGAQSEATRKISVAENQGNTTPRVTIGAPDHLSNPGVFGGTFAPGEVTFRGTVSDTESPHSELVLRWTATPVMPGGPPLEPVEASTLAVFDFPADQNRAIYEIVFSATDRQGLEGKKIIRIIIAPDN